MSRMILFALVFLLLGPYRAYGQTLCKGGVSPAAAQSKAIETVRSVACMKNQADTGLVNAAQALIAKIGPCIASERAAPADAKDATKGVRLTYPVLVDANLAPITFVTVEGLANGSWKAISIGASPALEDRRVLVNADIIEREKNGLPPGDY